MQTQLHMIPTISARSTFLCASAVLQNHPHPVVRSHAIFALQQLHMFSPAYVDLSSLVPLLCKLLASQHVVLRRSAVSSLRQFAQREATEICVYASTVDWCDVEAAADTPSSSMAGTSGIEQDGDSQGLGIIRLNYQLGESLKNKRNFFRAIRAPDFS